MKKIFRIITMAVFCVSSAVALEARTKDQGAYINEKNNKIVVEIDYGNIQSSRTADVPAVKGKTALEVLQTVATVETQPVGQNVIVTSIDGVKGKRGEMAWYYTVDDKAPGELAYSKVLNGTEHVKWSYKKDVCSWKVDGKPNPAKEGGGQG